jgi:predicted enzyme related to lactoylglutathione lyase
VTSIVRAVMFFCEEPATVARWWSQLLDVDSGDLEGAGDFVRFVADDVEFGFHLADPLKNPVGGSPVVYVRTTDHSAALPRARSLGARLHRGPLSISPSRVIAQLTDPFGNIFGLDGPATGGSGDV